MKTWRLPLLGLAATSLLAGCVAQPVEDVQRTVTATATAATPLEPELIGAVARVLATHGGQAGVAIHTAGTTVHIGQPGQSPAWSTIKVPVAIAAEEAGVARPEWIDTAITVSDNDSAFLLFASLGGDGKSVEAVEGLLGRYGNAPDMAALGLHGGSVPYGWTPWLLSDQAAFATQLPCIEAAEYTYDRMGEVVEWQRYGLGQLPEARFKGGWGPGTDDLYTVRQFGTVPVEEGLIGVAIVAHPRDGELATGEAMLDDLATEIGELIDAGAIAPADPCSP